MKWSDRQVECPIHEAFDRQVGLRADRPAIVGTSRTLTYRELDGLANGYAAALLARRESDTPAARVALLLGHDGPLVAGALAALRCGMAVVTLNLGDPPARLSQIREDTDPELLLTDAAHLDQARSAGFDEDRLVVVSGIPPTDDHLESLPQVRGDDLAFLICTSGSTGRPKVVMQSHRNMVHNVLRYTNGLEIEPDDRLAWLASLSGGQGLATTWTALLNGATLCPFPIAQRGVTGLADWIEEHDITVFDTIPSVLRNFARTLRDRHLGGVRLVRLASEAAQPGDIDAYRNHFPAESRLATVFASSEAGIIAQRIVDPDEGTAHQRLAVGFPAEGVDVLVVDDRGDPAGDGEPGEIVVQGRYLSPGYWGDPELTAQRFEAEDGIRRFRSGDIGRRGPGGLLTVLGRGDGQVKVRGHRLQLEEIEAAIAGHPDVAAAAAAVRANARGDARLTAFITAADGREPVSAELRRSLGSVLAPHAIPAAFVILDSLPINAHGKIDRQRLAELEPPHPSGEGAPETSTETEELLLGLWSEAFDSGLGPDDRFLDLGGDSLSAAVIAAGVHELLGVELDLKEFLKNPTLVAMAASLEERRRGTEADRPPPLRKLIRMGPLSLEQLPIWNTAADAGTGYTVAVPFRIRGPLNVRALGQSIAQTVIRHEILRTTFTDRYGAPMALVRPPAPIAMAVDDLRGEPDPPARASAILDDEITVPFDLERGPLLRLRLLRVGDEEWRLVRISHHLLHDAASWRIFFGELAVIYEALVNGERSPLTERPQFQFLDYAQWQRDNVGPASPSDQAELDWWQAKLEDAPPGLRLPFARAEPDEGAERSGMIEFGIAPESTSALDRLGREASATYFMTRLAVFVSLLAIETGMDDLLIATAVSTRTRTEHHEMFGPFYDNAVLRLRFTKQRSFREWLAEVRDEVIEVGRHAGIHWGRLMHELHQRGVELPTPLPRFHALWAPPPMHFGGIEVDALARRPGEVRTFLLDVNRAYEADRSRAEFDPRVHDPAGVESFVSRFQALTAAVCEEPDRPLGELHHAKFGKSRRDPVDWDGVYAGPPPPWDIGHPQPAIEQLAQRGLLSGRVLDVGCGTGEHAILAAAHGGEALGVDISPVAIELARRKARERSSGAQFAVADALDLSGLGELFDVVIDSGLFTVFDASEQRRYAASLAGAIRGGGVLYLTCICDQQPGDWGPHRVTREEIERTFGDGWVIRELTTCTRELNRPELQTWEAKAWMATIRRVESPVPRPGTEPAVLASMIRAHVKDIERSGQSPLFVALMWPAAHNLEAGGVIADVFEGSANPRGSAPALRLFAALHFLVLSGRAPDLAPYFPTAGGTAVAAITPVSQLWPAVHRTLASQLEQARSLVRRPVQTNEPERGAALFGALLQLVERHAMPVRLLEIGASAGLNLLVDHFHYRIDGRSLGDTDSALTLTESWPGFPLNDPAAAAGRLEIVARSGCDRMPIDALTEAGRLRLLSYIWPDRPERVGRIDAAIEVAKRLPVVVEPAAAAGWLPGALARRNAGELTVIWQSLLAPYLTDAERDELEASIVTAGEASSDERPLALIELEGAGSVEAGLRLRVRSWPGGGSEVLAHRPWHSPLVTWEAVERASVGR